MPSSPYDTSSKTTTTELTVHATHAPSNDCCLSYRRFATDPLPTFAPVAQASSMQGKEPLAIYEGPSAITEFRARRTAPVGHPPGKLLSKPRRRCMVASKRAVEFKGSKLGIQSPAHVSEPPDGIQRSIRDKEILR